MKNRIKLTAPIIQSRAQMETLVGEIAQLQLRCNEITAQMDQAVTAARQRFEGQVDTLQRELDLKTQAAQVWADTNPAEFGEKKSLEFIHATVGFRTSPPKITPLKKTFTVKVITGLLAKLDWGKKYIRQPDPQIDKEAILADRKELPPEKLAKVGLEITQDETFYIDLKATETDTRHTAAA